MNKLLFIALSDSQERYYHALNEEFDKQLNTKEPFLYKGKVIRIANLKSGRAVLAKKWCAANNVNYSAWLNFKLQTEKTDQKPLIIQKLTRHFLEKEALRFFDGFRKLFEEFSATALVVYNGAHYKQQAALSLVKHHNLPVLYHELGCLPNTTAIDNKGVNYLSSVPRERTFYEDHLSKLENILEPPKNLVARESRKAVETNHKLPKNYIFVPFQVHDDTQVLLHSPWIADMSALYELLEASLSSLPENYSFVIKEHPTDKKSYPHLHNKNDRIAFANGNNTQDLIESSIAVATINSTVGIEALLLDKPVLTLGNAFYNISGLVYACKSADEFIAHICKPEKLEHSPELNSAFFDYIQRNHLVAGRPKTFDKEHLQYMTQRMIKLINES